MANPFDQRGIGSLSRQAVAALLGEGESLKRIAFLAGVSATTVRRGMLRLGLRLNAQQDVTVIVSGKGS